MKSRIIMAALAVAVAAPGGIPAIALAQGSQDQRAQDQRSQEQVYHGQDERYRYRCERSKGTTGLLAGGAGGALLGHAVLGGPVGIIAGAVGGGLLGKHLDKKHDAAENRRNGC